MATTGQYTMAVSNANKTIDMTVSGTFTAEKAQAFVSDYQRKS